MWQSAKNPKWVESKESNLDQIRPPLEMDNTLKFIETNLFLIEMDYLHTVKVLLYFSNLKLNFLQCLVVVN